MSRHYEQKKVLERFGDALRNARITAGMTQEKAGDIAGITREVWSMLENGRRNVTLVTAERASVAVGSSLTQVMMAAYPERADELIKLAQAIKKGNIQHPTDQRHWKKSRKV